MTDTIDNVPRELLEKWADKLEGSDSAGYGWEDMLASELRALLAQPDSVPDEVPVLGNALSSLLPALDDALEDLEIHGRHSDRGYVKLKAWYGAMRKATNAIDAAMAAKSEQDEGQ